MTAVSPKLMVVLPTYNERDNIRDLAAALFDLEIPNLQLLIVDDNSPDGTGQIADELAASGAYAGRVYVLHRQRKQGLGPAYKHGFRQALAMGAELIIHMDADFSHQPKYLPRMLEEARENDLVVGSRYMRGGSVDENWGPLRKLLSWWANRIYTPCILNMPLKDATGGFRLYHRETLIGMDIDQIKSNGYVFTVEMVYVAHKLGFRIAEVPIHFPDRVHGRSKMTGSIALEAALRVFQIRFRHRHLNPVQRRTTDYAE